LEKKIEERDRKARENRQEVKEMFMERMQRSSSLPNFRVNTSRAALHQSTITTENLQGGLPEQLQRTYHEKMFNRLEPQLNDDIQNHLRDLQQKDINAHE
jgi:hypothetical protein